MIEVRFHGRGGQGAVTLAELMAKTAINGGKYAQAFPSFGPERRGAPVTAFLRISDEPIRLREKIYEPNVVVVLDPTVMNVTKVDAGLKKDGLLIVNTGRPLADMKKQYAVKQRMATVDANNIAMEILGVPITNTVMMGAFAKTTGVIPPEAVKEPFEERFGPVLAAKNLKAFQEAYSHTHEEGAK